MADEAAERETRALNRFKVEKLLDQLMKMVWDDSMWEMVEQVMQTLM